MKQTLVFENDAYRRLCGELVRRRHPGRWITCGAVAVVIMAAAFSLIFFAHTPVVAESPLRNTETEREKMTASIEPLPEVITRTHTETVAVPVQVTITQESETEPSMTESCPMTTLSEPITPDTEPISYDNPTFTDVLEPIHAGDHTFFAESERFGELFLSWKNEQTGDEVNNFFYSYNKPLRWYWTGDELFMTGGDECYRYCPGDRRPLETGYSQTAECLRYRWSYLGEDYTYFTRYKTLYRRQESNGKEIALYHSDYPLAIACVSGRYLFFDEKTPAVGDLISSNQLYRVDLLTGEKNCLFSHSEMFPYYGKDGEDLLFIYDYDSSSLMRVRPDGNYQEEEGAYVRKFPLKDEPYAQEFPRYDEPAATPDEPQKAMIKICMDDDIWSDDDNSIEVDLTDEVLEMYPDADVTMNSATTYCRTGGVFCSKIFEIREYKNQYAVLGVYIGTCTENGITGKIQTVQIPEFDGHFPDKDNITLDESDMIGGFPYRYYFWNESTGDYDLIDGFPFTYYIWDNNIGDYKSTLLIVPYDLSASSDSAE